MRSVMRRLSAAVLFAVLASLVSTPGALAWTWPVDGPVLRPFSVGPDPYAGGQHRGVDIGAEVGRTVVAPVGGTVSFVGFVPGGGHAVTITTDDGYAVTLLQLAATSVARGDAVAEGAEVGRGRREQRRRHPAAARPPRRPRRRRPGRICRPARPAARACTRAATAGVRAAGGRPGSFQPPARSRRRSPRPRMPLPSSRSRRRRLPARPLRRLGSERRADHRGRRRTRRVRQSAR